MTTQDAPDRIYAHLLQLPTGTSRDATAAALRLTALEGDAAWLLTLGGDAEALRAEVSARGGRLLEVEDVSDLDGAHAEVAALVEFDGPRSPVQAAADRFATRERVGPAARQVPGTGGAICLRGEDGAYVAVAFAQSEQALDAASRTILSTPLLAGEDPTLLGGPDRWTACRVEGAEHLTAMTDLSRLAGRPS